jgi:glycosyltransferase involved in cell wall biosynthesis
MSQRRRRKILFLIDRLQLLGGAESVLLRMTRKLPERGFDCSIVTLDPQPLVHTCFPCPVTIVPLRGVAGRNGLECAWRLISTVRREKPDIVQCFFETSDLWGGPLARLAGCRKLISSMRDMGFRLAPRHRKAYRLLHPIFSQVHAVADDVRRMCIEELGFPPDKAHCVYNGLDLAAFDRQLRVPADPRSLGIHPRSRMVLTVGNLRPVKGVDILIEAAGLLKARFPELVFAAAGAPSDTAYAAQLERRIEELGLGNVFRLIGSRSDVASLLPLAEVYCQLSRSEGFSNALLEAMAAQVPCIATRVGGNPVLIQDERNGLLVPPENPQAAADAIAGFLNDAPRSRRFAVTARQDVEERFTEEAMISRLVELYGRLVPA